MRVLTYSHFLKKMERTLRSFEKKNDSIFGTVTTVGKKLWFSNNSDITLKFDKKFIFEKIHNFHHHTLHMLQTFEKIMHIKVHTQLWSVNDSPLIWFQSWRYSHFHEMYIAMMNPPMSRINSLNVPSYDPSNPHGLNSLISCKRMKASVNTRRHPHEARRALDLSVPIYHGGGTWTGEQMGKPTDQPQRICSYVRYVSQTGRQ